MLTRTQISLTERQRRYLQRVAHQRGTSVAHVIRSIVDREIERETTESGAYAAPDLVPADHPFRNDAFWGIVGMAASGEGKSNEQLDDVIYGKDW